MVCEEGILELDVAVHHTLVVHVVHCTNQLLEEPAGIVLLQTTAADSIVEEVSARCVLHGNANVFCSEEDLFEFDDVWVVEAPMIVDLALYILTDLLATLDKLNCQLLPIVPSPGQLDKSKASSVEVTELFVSGVRRVHKRVFHNHACHVSVASGLWSCSALGKRAGAAHKGKAGSNAKSSGWKSALKAWGGRERRPPGEAGNDS
mmetsp:Transcript_3322/g.9561  ORF Transcript_3322/g.9561 Transcript_3322/m.9561 type:complete len:205 (+) Transcript_3322:662-1276(+)